MTQPLPAALGEHESFHAWLKQQDDYEEQIAAFSFYPPQHAKKTTPYTGKFSPQLESLGIVPYAHQAEGLLLIEAGQHVVIATPTASGKSLTYQVPTLHALQNERTALYLFPTKALTHDQLDKLTTQADRLGVTQFIASYDGDTPARKRAGIRENARCIFTNPDMLHFGVLPHHQQWARFLGRLEYVVIDELHSYRGVMGAHVANIVRRLLRLCWHYGARPRIIAASATIGNPEAHAKNLTGLEFIAVKEDAGPRAAREFIFWQPPELSTAEDSDGRRRSANTEASALAAKFVKAGLKSIFFCNSRKSAELLKRYASGTLSETEANQLQSYRAGYTAADRRNIETAFKDGRITVLTATSALELGVDVGGVDAVVLVGYPGSMTALWQRAGRAGRGSTRSLTLLIAGNDPLDEYYLHHPDLILDGKVEHAVADAFNTEIHPLHLACAAYEKPLGLDEELIGEQFDLSQHPKFKQHRDVFLYTGTYPHANVSVRGTGGKTITLQDGFERRIGISDYQSALRDLHPGAVYLHQGDTYLVRDLDLEAGVATLLPHIEDYYTQTRSVTEIDILESEYSQYGVTVGRVRVATEFTSFVKKKYYSETILDERLLDLPLITYNTQALWFNVRDVAQSVSMADLPSAMHALEHTLIGLLPVFVLCERADVGGVSYPMYPATGEPLIFIYDGYPGGVGYTRAGTSLFPDWLQAAITLLQDCPCKTGCPRCTLSPKCGNGNQYLDKHAALTLARALNQQLKQQNLPAQA